MTRRGWPGHPDRTGDHRAREHKAGDHRAGDKVGALRAMSPFANCPDRELGVLASSADECLLPAGHVLMWEGDPGAEAFLVLEGQADVAVAGQVIARVGPGETVGEMALIDNRPRTATVVARTPLRVLVVGRRHLGALVDQPGVARGLLEILTSRLREADVQHTAGRVPSAATG